MGLQKWSLEGARGFRLQLVLCFASLSAALHHCIIASHLPASNFLCLVCGCTALSYVCFAPLGSENALVDLDIKPAYYGSQRRPRNSSNTFFHQSPISPLLLFTITEYIQSPRDHLPSFTFASESHKVLRWVLGSSPSWLTVSLPSNVPSTRDDIL